MRESRVRFIRQLGVTTPNVDDNLYSALMLQPRIIAVIVALGIVAQSPLLFLVLSVVLLWSALVPSLNPFDAIYNFVARRRGVAPLDIAAAPRRFAMGMAGTVALTIGVALAVGASITAWVFQGLFAVAVIQVVFGDICGAANLYHLLHRSPISRPAS
ncbi:MAG TPA: DUF4395 family protein [Vicinamibacterales bacterium]